MAIFSALSVFVTGLVFVFVLLQYRSLRDSIDLGGPVLLEREGTPPPKVSIVIPAYNEEENIRGCVLSALEDVEGRSIPHEVIVVDDLSVDKTWEVLVALRDEIKNSRLKIVKGEPKDSGQPWQLGKSWPCQQGADIASGEYILFVDCDVRLKSGAVARLAHEMSTCRLDLLLVRPKVECRSLAERVFLSNYYSILLFYYQSSRVNDPKSKSAAAVGQVMMFTRRCYDTIGGHRSSPYPVLEDGFLAKAVKKSGFALGYCTGKLLCEMTPYSSFRTLWEGQTKEHYIALGFSKLRTMVYSTGIFSVFSMPFILAGYGLIELRLLHDPAFAGFLVFHLFAQYLMRRFVHLYVGITPRYWWLNGLSGLFTASLFIASMIKVETGISWTWRGKKMRLG